MGILPLNFLKAAGKAVVKYCGNAVGFGVGGELILEFGLPIVEDIWEAWGKEKNDDERRAEIEAVAQATAKEIVRQVGEIVQEVASDQPPEYRQFLGAFLTQIPATVCKSLCHKLDPPGRSLLSNAIPRKPADLLRFLPPKLSRFKPGDCPLPGVDWELETLLGVGGFGEVWKGRNPYFDGVAPIALKFCLLDRKGKEKLLRHEAAVLNQVMRQGKHEGIVQLLHTYLSAEPPCLAYEYIEDGDLAGIIEENKPTGQSAAKIILSLAEIVGFAHRLTPPVVHRDLKPANILVRQTNDKKITLKVADFGIGGLAATQAIGEASSGMNRGKNLASVLQGAYTPFYASPQQIRGEQPDPRDDVYSLGVIWYQLLTGNLDTGRPGGRRWRDKIADALPSRMLDLLEACIEDDPNDRPENAAVMAERLAVILGERSLQTDEPPINSATVPATTNQKWQVDNKPFHLHRPGEIITNSLGMKFAWIPPGTFTMGSPKEEKERYNGEIQHKVTLTSGFFMGVHLVTQEQWKAVMGENPRNFSSNPRERNLPVHGVSWYESHGYCENLRKMDSKPYRLPTEAEWEYACRAGTTTAFNFGAEYSNDQANCRRKELGSGFISVIKHILFYPGKITPVGSFPANAWGLHDMHGNEMEWCEDWYGDYPQADAVDPRGPNAGDSRVLRGGCYGSIAGHCRSAARAAGPPGDVVAGLRVCFS